MSEEYPKAQLERVASLLVANGVEFLVIGGQAEYLFGSPRATFDVDICYRRTRENLEKLARCLQLMKARLRGAPDAVPFILDAHALEMGSNFTFKTDFGDLDILGFVEPIGAYERLTEHHEVYDLGSFAVQTIGLDDLLRIKLHINRPKDQESITQLKAIKRVREEREGGASL